MSILKEAWKIKRPLLYLTGGLVLGETMALWIAASEVLWGLVPALLLLLFLCRKRWAGPVFFVLAFTAAGWIGGVFFMTQKAAALLETEAAASGFLGSGRGETVALAGTVKALEPASMGDKILLKNCSVIKGGQSRKLPASVLCYLDRGPAPGIGEKVLVSGTAAPMKAPRNPGEYDFRLSCFSKGIGCLFYGEELTVTGGRPYRLLGALQRLKESLETGLDRAASPKDAGILKAVLLGDRKDMEPQVYELYRRNGIAHLISISGLHVSVIGMGLWNLLRKAGMGRGGAGLAAGSVLGAYGLMIGFSASVGRAVFLLLLLFLADWLGRTYDLVSALCAAAVWLLAQEPYLLTQMGFQLSFLAVAGIALLGQPMIRAFRLPSRLSGAEPVFQAFLISFSVQAATTPVILYHSYEIPVYGILLNLLVIPPMAVVLYSGLTALFLSYIWETAAVFALGGSHLILLFYEGLCRAAQTLPGAVLRTGRPEAWQIAFYYGMILLMLGILKIKGGATLIRPMRGAVLAALWGAAFLFLFPVPEKGLRVTFLDVGQGDGIFLQTKEGNLLVDCGSSQNRELGRYSLEPFLKSQGVICLDTVVITHGDGDHISGIRYLLENPGCGIRICRLVMPEAGRGEAIYEEFERLAVAAGTKTDYIGRGAVFGLGSAGITCLHPSAHTVCKNRNDQSLVLFLEYGRFRMLLTGDLEDSGERELMALGGLGPVTVLKVGHHGSAGSSGGEFLEILSPAAAILSYGEGNRYGHPAGRVVNSLEKAGAELWETAKSGAVEVWTDGKSMKIRGFRKLLP